MLPAEKEKNKFQDELENEIQIGNSFTMVLNKKLGSGAFGEIFKGYNKKTNEEVAIKVESKIVKTPQLNYESKILKLLAGKDGIPSIYHISVVGEFTIMAMEMLDKNLDQLLKETLDKKFSLKTVLMIADQAVKFSYINKISRIEYVHSMGLIHRDIKPENLLIGNKKKSHVIYLIDFGLAKRYIDVKTGNHIQYVEGKQLTGTAKFASIYTHMGIEQSRRDDLESFGYVLIYLLKGELPWTGIKAKSKIEKHKKIMEKKIESTPDVLCEGLPNEFLIYFNYFRELQFHENPNYSYLKDLITKLMLKNQYIQDYKYDWSIKKDDDVILKESSIDLFSKLKMNFDFASKKPLSENESKKNSSNLNTLFNSKNK